jgi:hypothetical protein
MKKRHRLGSDPYDPHDNILAGISCMRPMAPARLVIGSPCRTVCPSLSARITRLIQSSGIPKRADASAMALVHL